MQDEIASGMLFDVAALVAHSSDVADLRRRDRVLTGSPPGDGAPHGAGATA